MSEERDELRLTAIQIASSLAPAENLESLGELVRGAMHGYPADLVVLPEVFARDFGTPGSDVSAYAEPTDGPFASEVERVANRLGTTIVAGMFETSPDATRPYNTLVMRGKASADYRKVHLYDSFGYRESDRLSPGPLEPCVATLGGWKIGLMTCYDLRFPELARRLVDAGAEILVVSAAWVAGQRKVDHWRTLVRARAIENTAFVVACGQPAPRYSGHSMIVDPLGDVLAEADDGPDTISVVVRRACLEAARTTNPSLTNRRL